MAFLDVLGKKITQTGQEVVQKTKDTAEVLKYYNMISEEERNIESLYKEIGKLYVETFGDFCEGAFADLVAKLKASQKNIEEYRHNIVQIKGVAPCPNCGEELPLNVAFCSVCGTKIKKEDTPETSDFAGKHCKNCGAPVEEGYVFCINCGAKYEEIPEETGVEAVEEVVETVTATIEETVNETTVETMEVPVPESTEQE